MSWTPPEHDRARELRAHLPVDGWRAAVTAIGARHGLPTAEARPFETGSDVVWSLGEHVVKLTAPVWRVELEAEARLLGRVAGRLPVATPEVVARGALAGWPYVVTTRVAGVALGRAWGAMDRPARLHVAAALGELLRALHALDPGDEPDGWAAFWRACRTDVARRHARPGVPEALLREIEPFLARHGELDAGARALLHTEVLDEHVLVAERAGRVVPCALLDFADGRLGAPEYEFAAPVEFVLRGEPGLLRALLTAYGDDPAALGPARSERMLAWALCHRFGSLERMLRAVAPARPGSLGELARTLYGF